MEQLIMVTTLCHCGDAAISQYSYTAGGRYFSVGLCELHWLHMLKGPDRPHRAPASSGPASHE